MKKLKLMFMAKNKLVVIPKYSKKLNTFNASTEISSENSNAVIDLQQVNLEQLLLNLKHNLATKPSRFIFLKRRENEKFQLEADKISVLINSIQNLRTAGLELNKLRSDAILSSQELGYLIAERELDFNNAIELKVKEQETKIHSLNIEKEKKEVELLHLKLEAARIQAEIDWINALTEQEKENANLIKVIVAEIKDMPSGAILAIWHDFMNRNKPDSTSFTDKDYDLNEFFSQYRKSKMKEDLKQTKAETKERQSKSDFEQWKNKQKMDGEV